MSKNSIVTQKKPPVQPRAPLLILIHKEIEAKQVETKLEWYVFLQFYLYIDSRHCMLRNCYLSSYSLVFFQTTREYIFLNPIMERII